MVKLLQKHQLLIIIILCFLTRLPQLLSANLLLDGDECIVGLMAKHFSEGKEIPWFFYGQVYGFSFIEVIFITVSYFIFGISGIAVKIAMLLMWTIGIVFFYKTLKQIFTEFDWLPLLITLVFIFSPSWFEWSMKARGGYLTSFALFSVCTFLLTKNKLRRQSLVSALLGFVCVIIYESQPLWLAGLLPLLAFQLYKLKLKKSFFFFGGIALSFFIIYLIKINTLNFWNAPEINISNFNKETLFSIPLVIYNFLTGSYYYNEIITPAIIIKIWSIVFEIMIILGVIYGIYYLVIKRKRNPYLFIFCLSVIFTIGYLFLVNDQSPRYLLPLSGCSLLLFSSIINSVESKTASFIILGFLIISGLISIFSTKTDNLLPAKKSEISNLIKDIELKGIHHVYCKDGLLQWQIDFYSKEKVIARFFYSTDRYPKYIRQVDETLEKTPEKTAIVGIFYPELNDQLNNLSVVNERFFIVTSPSIELLKLQGFDMTKSENK